MTSPPLTILDAEARWRAWEARGLVLDRRTVVMMRRVAGLGGGVLVVVSLLLLL